MSRPLVRRLIFAGWPILYLLHNDFWLWDDPRIVLGLPVGLLYHAAFCVAATVLMTLMVTLAWPMHLEVEEEQRGGR